MAKKNGHANGADETPSAGHNGPSVELIRDFARQIIAKDNEIDEVNDARKSLVGQRRAMLKAAKKAGIQQDVLVRVIADRRRELSDVIDEERTYVRYAALLNMPLHQQDLFPPSEEPIRFTDDSEEAQKQRIFDADDGGYRAGLNGRSIDDNPHHQAEASDEFTSWRAGWHRGQAHLAKGLTKPKSQGRRATSGNPEDRPAA
jgi:ribosome modulation factor